MHGTLRTAFWASLRVYYGKPYSTDLGNLTLISWGSRTGKSVTGALGFIGSAVVRALVARRAHVVAVVEPGADCGDLEAFRLSASRRTGNGCVAAHREAVIKWRG